MNSNIVRIKTKSILSGLILPKTTRQLYRTFLVAIAGFTFFAGVSNSGGAEAGHTGAPSENTCGFCHRGTPNTGTGTGNLTLGDTSTTYTPGKEYELLLTCDEESINKFGFQVTALTNDNIPAGTFPKPTGNIQRLLTKKVGANTREYITHASSGTSTTTPGKKEWKIKWTAPPSNEGDITFYVAWMAADGNGQANPDDKIYTFKQTFAASQVSKDEIKNTFNWSISPNPANDKLTLQIGNSKLINGSSSICFEIIDLQGKTILKDKWRNISANFTPEVDIHSLAKGIYITRLTVDGNTFTKKLQIEN